jgi:glucose-6-phosphate 1-dehydrogenase
MTVMAEILQDENTGGSTAHTFVLFGATGDLAKRKLYPALFHLHLDGELPDGTIIIGAARTQDTDDQFRRNVRESLEQFAHLGQLDEEQWRTFSERLFYCRVDVTKAEEFQTLQKRIAQLEKERSLTGNRLFYLAMAPQFFGVVAKQLQSSGLAKTTGWRRLVIEKPFGTDFDSAQKLNDELREVFEEEEIYRIDHYLGKEMVQNIEVIRFANSIFEPVWNNRSIANVQITSSETVGVEERAAYYDKAGALRDMVQNHMLQMVMMVAMEPPSRLKTEAIRDEKVKVLRSLRRYTPEEVKDNVVRGQYGAGTLGGSGHVQQAQSGNGGNNNGTGSTGGEAVPAYRNEPNVSPDSNTETYIAARLLIDNFRWAGVPFYIRTGKRMAAKATEIVIQFREMPRNLYFNQEGNLGPDLLVIRVSPLEGMYIQLNAKKPGTEGTVVPVAMEYSQPSINSPEAYERLLHDAIHGDSTFFTRWDEVSLAWKFVDPLAEAFTSNQLQLQTYASGSWGPEAASELLARDGAEWWPVYGQETAFAERAQEREIEQKLK